MTGACPGIAPRAADLAAEGGHQGELAGRVDGLEGLLGQEDGGVLVGDLEDDVVGRLLEFGRREAGVDLL